MEKTKGTHFSTGPTTSSRHSKNGLDLINGHHATIDIYVS